MKKFLKRLLALIGGKVVGIATSLALIALHRFGINFIPLYVTIPIALLGCLTSSQVKPRLFFEHAFMFLAWVAWQTAEIEVGREGLVGGLVCLLYFLGWIGLIGSAFVLPVGMPAFGVTLLSFFFVMLPFTFSKGSNIKRS